ncbi:hypothetical protein GGR52DRAFT_387915 [Hypoxylon sp. FL1284]|nr:hypothetical protein GGR52DRAFT_387915 [Hypoxylon sp. FL1284]
MPPNNNPDQADGDSWSDSDKAPTIHPRWPVLSAANQGMIERRLFQDGATIHFDRLHMRNFLLIKSAAVPYSILALVTDSAKAAQRPLTAGEVEATSEIAANASLYFTWARPMSLAGAFLYTQYRQEKQSFMFVRLKALRFDPNIFPTKRLPLLTGANAAAAWQIARILSHAPFFYFLSLPFLGSLVRMTFDANVRLDSRLQNLLQDIKTNSAMRAQQRQGQRVANQLPENRQFQHDGPGTNSQPEDAMGGSAPSPSTAATTPTPLPAWSQSLQPRDDVSDLFDDDDGSPVPASVRRAELQQDRSAQGGSTWDRVRQQSQSGSAQWRRGDSSGQERGWGRLRQDKTQNTGDAQRRTENYSYTQDEERKEQKNYEKEQAQKEFDAMLEAERRGGSGGR